MACSFPLTAFQCEDGSVVFTERKGHPSVRSLLLPCGRCARCRLERSRQWAVRCMHEAKLYDDNCFITLTYDDSHLPVDRSLRYVDFQKFMKRLRRRFFSRTIRFYMCGEYGDQTERPHYHAVLFNVDFADKLYFKKTADFTLYTSKILSDLWFHGSHLIGSVTFESAAYVARYCMASVTGPEASGYYGYYDAETGEVLQRVPEFGHMSLRPGIGKPWLDRFLSDVYPGGEVVVNGRKAKAPRYYDKCFRVVDDTDALARIEYRNYLRGRDQFLDNTPERLAVKEQVAIARLAQMVKTL